MSETVEAELHLPLRVLVARDDDCRWTITLRSAPLPDLSATADTEEQAYAELEALLRAYWRRP